MLAHNPPFDVIVFHRPRYSFGLRLTLRRLRKAGTLCVADFDDMVFNPDWAPFSPGVVNQQVSLQQTRKNFNTHAKALKLFKHASVSTTPLVSDMQTSHDQTPWFIPNAVHLHWRDEISPHGQTQAQASSLETTNRIITYFPGTRSHDRDFSMIKAPLQQVLAEHPHAALHITGELADDGILQGISAQQLVRHPKQAFADYRTHVARSQINLAPLEQTEFNQRKSALKAIEASYFNAPTLASPIPDMQRLESAGAVLVESNDSAWYDALSHAIKAPASILRSAILTHADAHQIARDFLHQVHKARLAPHG